MAGNSAELLNASKNSARTNMDSKNSFRAFEVAARPGAGASSSMMVGFFSPVARVSIVFVAVITTPYGFESSPSFFSDTLGLGTAVGVSSTVFAVEIMLEILGSSGEVVV